MALIHLRMRVALPGESAQTVSLKGERIVIGRDAECDLVLPHPAVSRRHVELFSDGSSGVFLSDLGSRNGLTLNQQSVGAQPIPIRKGDELRIGPVSAIVLALGDTAQSVEEEPEAKALKEKDETHDAAPVVVPAPSGDESRPPPESKPASESGLLSIGHAVSWGQSYREAIQGLREEFGRLWQVVKSRTPPTRAGEMGAMHEAVQAGITRLDRVAEGIEQANDRLAKLLEAARTVSAPQPLRQRLETILDLAIAKMNADCGFLMLYSRRRRGLKLAIQRGMDIQTGFALGDAEPDPPRPDAAIARRALRSGTTVLQRGSPSSSENLGRTLADMGIHAAICAPMKVEERFIGLIYVDFRDPMRLTGSPLGPEDAGWLQSLGSLAALAIENARLIEKSRRASREPSRTKNPA